jgi:hypothetical protein
MTSLTNKYTELSFTKKAWEFVSEQKDYPFNNLPEEGSGSRNIFTMKDVKAVLPKTTKNNSLGIFASKAAKELFEKSGLDQTILKNPSGTKGGFTTKDIKKVLPKKKNSLGIFASKAAKELFEKSGLDQTILKNPSGIKGGFTTKDVKKVLPKSEKPKKMFASKVAKELFEQSSDTKEVKKILTGEKPMGKTELYSKAEVEKAILIYTIKQEKD